MNIIFVQSVNNFTVVVYVNVEAPEELLQPMFDFIVIRSVESSTMLNESTYLFSVSLLSEFLKDSKRTVMLSVQYSVIVILPVPPELLVNAKLVFITIRDVALAGAIRL